MSPDVFTVHIVDDEEKDEPVEQFICDLILGSGLAAQIDTDQGARRVTVDIVDNDRELLLYSH